METVRWEMETMRWDIGVDGPITPTCSECGRPVNTETVPDADYYICEVCEKTITDHPGAGIVSRVGA